MRAVPRSVAFAALAALAVGGCELRCNGPVTIIPVNIKYGGRAIAVATHPSDDKSAFVVSESGGIFRTRNAGDPWFLVTGKSTFWFSDVHYYDPDPNIVIATALADLKVANSGGVWRSTNGGDSWTHIAITPPDTIRPFEAYSIAVEPSEPPRIWVGTSLGLTYSDDQGVHWSFLPVTPATAFRRDAVWAVLAPNPGHLRMYTRGRVRASDDRGATWNLSIQGILPDPHFGTHDQLAVSPTNDAILYWCGWFGDGNRPDSTVLIRSTDSGRTWLPVMIRKVKNRDPFVRVTPRSLGSDSKYQVYFSDGSSYLGRVEVNKSDEKIGSWQTLSVEHVDCSDLGFKTDGYTPWLLTGDGGLQTTTDKGAHWKMFGNGSAGYRALQISEAVGQTHSGNREADFYFGTQDNLFWASGDNGRTWPYFAPTEGNHLDIGARPGAADSNRITFFDHGTFDYIAGPRFTSPQPTLMKVPQGPGHSVRRLADHTYMKAVGADDIAGDRVWVTYNNGGLWFHRCDLPNAAMPNDRIKMIDAAGQQIVYLATARIQGNALDFPIARMYGLAGSGTPFVSSVEGFGQLGFAGAKAMATSSPIVDESLYAVDPFDPDHLLVVDQGDTAVRVTHDGGASWAIDANLKRVITSRGTYHFTHPVPWGQRGVTQVLTIAFDPYTRGRILVGTIQAGVIFSCDFGQSWRRLEDSENIPNVSSFTFTAEGWVLASSYGRDLWRLSLKCPPPDGLPPLDPGRPGVPMLYVGGTRIPLRSLEADPRLSFVLTPPANADSAVRSDPKLAALVKLGRHIEGSCVEDGRLRGFLLADRGLTTADLPAPRVPGPSISLTVSGEGNEMAATITGMRFEPGRTLEVTMNGEIVPISVSPARDGTFKFGVPVPSRPGHYILMVRQNGSRGLLSAAVPFDVRQTD